MILDRTPAYAESGGQVGDTGTIAGRAGRGQLLDTYYRGPKLIVHRVRVVQGGFHEGEDVAVSVETPRRQGLRQHHTGTHLLHAALRRVLGTHVAQAGSLVASGHRRIEAVAGSAALETVARKEAALREAAEILKIAPLEVPKRLAKLLEEQRVLAKQLAELEARLARSRAEELIAAARQINGVAVVTGRIDGLDADGLRSVADTLRDRLGSGVVCVGSVTDGKVNLVAAVTKDLVKRFQAGRLMQEVAGAVGGRGGGRPDLAQGGGPDPSALDAALTLVYDVVARATG